LSIENLDEQHEHSTVSANAAQEEQPQ
jgi:hypothetical protein